MESLLVSMMPFIAVFAILYLIILRPQQQKDKKHQNMLKNLGKGDEIVTTGGIHGTIVGFNKDDKNDIVVLKISEPQVKVEVSRSAIAYLKKGGELIEGE